jgi:hypothetical protein
MAKRNHDPRQLDLLDWTPPTAEIVTHPAKWRAMWVPVVQQIAEAIIDEPEKAGQYFGNTPYHIGIDLERAGATPSEVRKHVSLYVQALHGEVSRRRHSVRRGPGAA